MKQQTLARNICACHVFILLMCMLIQYRYGVVAACAVHSYTMDVGDLVISYHMNRLNGRHPHWIPNDIWHHHQLHWLYLMSPSKRNSLTVNPEKNGGKGWLF